MSFPFCRLVSIAVCIANVRNVTIPLRMAYHPPCALAKGAQQLLCLEITQLSQEHYLR